MSALEPVCTEAGAEVDRPLRDMPAIVSLLTGGGYRLRVASSSHGWSADHAADHRHYSVAAPRADSDEPCEAGRALSLSSAAGTEV